MKQAANDARDSRVLMIDGKMVRCWLFAYRQQKSNVQGDFDIFLCQVQAFDLDHAVKRILLAFPRVDPKNLEMLEELDPEHDVGKMGTFLPLVPAGTTYVVPATWTEN